MRSFRNPFAAYGPPAPEVLVGGASLDQVTAAVNQNAQKIRTYQTSNASIDVPGSPGVPSLRGNIAAERPGRVRLQASTALTGSEVDLGSNEELFWAWFRRSEPPAIYTSRHDRYAGSAAQQFMPIEPQWLLDALGLAQFAPGEFHEGPTVLDKDRVEIKSVVNGPGGQVVKRRIIDARRAWVFEQHVYDARGTLLASAIAKSHRYYPEIGVSLPQQIDLQIPAANLQLAIDVGTVTLNAPLDNSQLWTLPGMPGVPVVDLSAMPPNSPGGGAAPLGDQMTRADWSAPTGPPTAVATTPGGALPTTPIVVPTPGAPAAQFVSPGGQAAPIDPFAVPSTTQTPVATPLAPAPLLPSEPTARRLPAGGVSAPSLFAR